MATREQLYQALQRADAAGDVETARRIARMLAGGAPAPSPDEPVDFGAQDAASIGAPEAMAIGAGRGFNDVFQGLKQIGLQSLADPSATPGPPGTGLIGRAGNALAHAGPFAKQVDHIQGWARDQLATQQKQQAGELESYAKLADASPWAAGAGRVAGNIAAMPVPGGQGATLTARGLTGAATGGLMAGAQYVPEGGSRTQNMLTGAALGAALPALFRGMSLTYGNVKKAAGWLRDQFPGMTQKSAERAAAQIIRKEAANPVNLAKAGQPSQLIPGTQQTLAEATDDPGIAALQRFAGTADQRFLNDVQQMAAANNTARVEAIRAGFGGADEAAARAIEAARDKATAPLLAAARKVKGVDVKPLVKLTDRIIESRKGNKTVVDTLMRVRNILDEPGMDNVQVLHNVRQEIGNILSGQSPTEAAGKAASRELMAIKTALDAKLRDASPEFRQFLDKYTQMSTEAGRVRMGAELLGKSFAARDPAGNPILSPAQFARAADDLDRVARAATGFRKQTAEKLMTPEQNQLVGAMRQDLDRYARSQTGGRVVGPDTAQKFRGAQRLESDALGGAGDGLIGGTLTFPLKLVNGLRRKFSERVVSVTQEMLKNPAQAQRILNSYPPQVRQQVMGLLDSPEFQQFAAPFMRGAPMLAGPAVAADGGQQ